MPHTWPVRGRRDTLCLVLCRAILFLLIGWLGNSERLSAQDSIVVRPGDRVRLSTDAGRFVGRLGNRANDSVTIVDAHRNTVVVVAVGTVRTLELSRGERRRTGRGAWIGLLSGTAAGVLTGLVVCGINDCSSSGAEVDAILAVALGAAGAVAGTGVGALVGSQIRSERWEEAPIAGLRIGLMRQRSGDLGVGFGLVWSP